MKHKMWNGELTEACEHHCLSCKDVTPHRDIKVSVVGYGIRDALSCLTCEQRGSSTITHN